MRQRMQRYLYGSAVLLALVTRMTHVGAAEPATIGPGLAAVLDAVHPGDPVSVIIRLRERVDLSTIKAKGRSEQRAKIVTTLKRQAAATRPPLLARLGQSGATRVQPFWIFNGVAATVPAAAVLRLAQFPGVVSIGLNVSVQGQVVTSTPLSVPEWNINAVKAPALWDLGFTGNGMVVATVDTGVDDTHPDLAANYRGGTNSWYDPQGVYFQPHDPTGHGTQVTGLIVGGDASGTTIGMAPDAQWIGVKLFSDSGTATYSDIHLSLQWLLDPDGDPASDDAPDAVNASWSLGNPGTCSTEFQEDLNVLRAADIALVFAAGNYGSAAFTSTSPANNAPVLATGAVDQSLQIGDFSARGVSACDGSIFPELAAPGVNVRTADKSSSYTTVAGTSYAAPHVTGAIALLRDAFPQASVGQIEQALLDSALDLGVAHQDNDYGYGLLDIQAAYEQLSVTIDQPVDRDSDGFVETEDCNDVDPSLYPGAPEVKHDNIDQDCNGYDLTIDVLRAAYDSKHDTLEVIASSALGEAADLVLEGYGAMRWSKKDELWAITARKVGGDPGSSTISGLEGSETAPTAVE